MSSKRESRRIEKWPMKKLKLQPAPAQLFRDMTDDQLQALDNYIEASGLMQSSEDD